MPSTSTMPLRAAALAALLGLALAPSLACSSTTTQGRESNANNAKTVGDQCNIVAKSFCDRAVKGCQLAIQGGFDGCISDYTAKCCLDSCSAPKRTADEKIQACSDALDKAECKSFTSPADGDPLPLACRRVVEVPVSDGGS